MKSIPLTKGFVVTVDDADYAYLSQFRWLANINRRGYVYAVGQVEGVRHFMHRLLCGQHGLVVDHINGDTLDNRRSNLRAVTSAVNASNQHSAPRSNTGIKNISRRQRDGKYVAQSSALKSGRVYLGIFDTVEQAQRAIGAYESVAEKGPDTIPFLLSRISDLEAENEELRARAAA